MSLVHKVLAAVLFPLSILILLEYFNFFSLNIFVDKVLLGSIILIIFQVAHFINLLRHKDEITTMNVVTLLVFCTPAVSYCVNYFFKLFVLQELSLVMGIMIFLESMYALH